MKKRTACTAMALAVVCLGAAVLTACESPENPATPDSASTNPAETAVSASTPATPDVAPPPPSEPSTRPEPDGTSPAEEEGEEMLFSEAFDDFPSHFVCHGGNPEEQGPSENYMDATIVFSEDGTMDGDFFSNLDTSGDALEQISNWSARVEEQKIYKVDEHTYYFYIDELSYENEPDSTGEEDGHAVVFAYGFGLTPNERNRLYLFTPDTPIDSLTVEGSRVDLRQFLTMMRKDGSGETLGCYLLRGRVDDYYVSITDEEAAMAPLEHPDPPESPQ